MSVVTRFAPSPTGFLHIGGARTALFNYLFARHHGGTYLLRIEDTDKARSTEEAKQAILDGLDWLGLMPDGDVVYQSQNVERHREVAMQLLAEGKAYKCFCSPEELQAMREAAQKEGGPSYDRRWRDTPESECPEAAHTIRIKSPLEGEMVIEDAVQGRITIPASELDDFILLRADGTPTYMLAVVVDDHDMGVTHTIRGDDHLNNAARQNVIFDAMGWDRPTYAHIPLIHGADGAKLSKRHGALGVDAYRDMGYLADAVNNYLLRLGWAHGDDEIISREQAIEWFGFDGMNKAASRFDFDKLGHLNGQYLIAMEAETLLPLVIPYVEKQCDMTLSDAHKNVLIQALPALKERARILPDIAEAAKFLFVRPVSPDAKAEKVLAESQEALTKAIELLSAEESWDEATLKGIISARAEANGEKLPVYMKPLRAALTGSMGGPGVFAILEWLGKDESLTRLQAAQH